MTEDRVPTTEAGRDLLKRMVTSPNQSRHSQRAWQRRILAIEREAAEQPVSPLDADDAERLLTEWLDYFAIELAEAKFPPNHLYARTRRYLATAPSRSESAYTEVQRLDRPGNRANLDAPSRSEPERGE